MTEHLISIIIQSISFGLQISLGIYFILFNSEKRKNLIVYFSFLTIGDYFSLFFNSFFPIIPFFIGLIIYIYLAHNKSLYPLISIPLTYMIVVFFNELYSGIFGFFFHINTETLINHYPLFFSYSILCILSIVTFILMGKKIVQHIIGQSLSSPSKDTILLLFTHTTIYGSIILIIVLTSPALMISTTAAITMCITIAFFFLLTLSVNYYILKRSEKTIISQEQLKQFENLKEYTENLEQLYNNIRSFKHDYINILTSISTYLDEKRYNDLSTYFHNEILPTKEALNHNSDTLNRLMHIKQLEVKSLLSYKMLYAIEQGIQIHIDIPDDIEWIDMKSIDLLRILGIFLDNAMEATLETAKPQLNVRMAAMDSYIAIMIENSYVDCGIPIGKMTQKGVTSKGEGHGMGLYNATEILKDYPNIIHETYTENSMFYQHLQISNT